MPKKIDLSTTYSLDTSGVPNFDNMTYEEESNWDTHDVIDPMQRAKIGNHCFFVTLMFCHRL